MVDEPKVALVTGGARRVGAAIARALHAAGCRVVVHCNESRDDAHALAEELNGSRADSAAVEAADLLDLDALAAMVGRTILRWGELDVLVNNASTFFPTPVGEVAIAQWDDLVGMNLRAPFFIAQAAAPALAKRGGAIVNILDIHASRPMKGHPVYSSAKAGLAMMTRALARELAPQIRVNGVAPGAVLWPEGGIGPEVKQQIIEATALKRHGSPDDVAQAVRFLALDAPFVTGQILAVDGGRF